MEKYDENGDAQFDLDEFRKDMTLVKDMIREVRITEKDTKPETSLWSRVLGFESWVSGCGLRVSGSGSLVSGLECWVA